MRKLTTMAKSSGHYQSSKFVTLKLRCNYNHFRESMPYHICSKALIIKIATASPKSKRNCNLYEKTNVNVLLLNLNKHNYVVIRWYSANWSKNTPKSKNYHHPYLKIKDGW